MEMVTGWTGSTACALQAALRLSNEAFAARLGIGVRTVAAWHQKPALCPRPEMQQLLDTALTQAPAPVRERFAVLAGVPGDAAKNAPEAGTGTGTGRDGAAADAEHRLIADQNISSALSQLDQLAGWEPGTARRQVAARLACLDRRYLLDRPSRRKRIARCRMAQALGEYYRGQVTGYRRYGARCGPDGDVVTSVLTHPGWLDLDCPLTAGHDRLTLAGAAAGSAVPLDGEQPTLLRSGSRRRWLPIPGSWTRRCTAWPTSASGKAGSAARWPSPGSPRTR